MSADFDEYSTGPVPADKTVGWFRVGLISAMVSFSLPTFVTGVEVSLAIRGGLGIQAILWGSLILSIVGSLCAVIGARTRLSSYLLAQVAFGRHGAALVNLAFAISLLGWFGFNIDLFSAAVGQLLATEFGLVLPGWWIELGAGTVMTITTLFGFRAINTLSLLLVPVLMVVTALLLNSALGNTPLATLLATTPTEPIPIGQAISAVVGGVIVGAVILPDITRFIRDWTGAIYTVVLSYAIVANVVMAAGGLAAISQADNDFLSIMITLGLGWAAFAIVIAGSWVLNSLNLYSAMLSVEATLPGTQGRLPTVLLGVLGTIAAFLNILDYFLTFLFYLSIVFVPVAGVIAVDYIWVRREAYHSNWQAAGRNYVPLALLAWGLGAMIALLGAENVIKVTGIAALDAMLVSALAYGVMGRLAKPAAAVRR